MKIALSILMYFYERSKFSEFKSNTTYHELLSKTDEQFVECVFNGWAKTKGAHESTSMFSINKLYDIAGWSTYINKTMGGRYDFDEVNYTHNTKELAKT